MNIIAETGQNLIGTFKHYACLRLRFRGSVLGNGTQNREQEPPCPFYSEAENQAASGAEARATDSGPDR